MNKTDLVNLITIRADVTRKQAALAIDAFIDGVLDAVEKGDVVTLSGFGSFRKRARQERKGRNPRTGEPMLIPARARLHFTPSKQLILGTGKDGRARAAA